MRPCQGRDGSSILPGRTGIILKRTRGEMDIMTVFGTVVVGSNPAGCAIVPFHVLNLHSQKPKSAKDLCWI